MYYATVVVEFKTIDKSFLARSPNFVAVGSPYSTRQSSAGEIRKLVGKRCRHEGRLGQIWSESSPEISAKLFPHLSSMPVQFSLLVKWLKTETDEQQFCSNRRLLQSTVPLLETPSHVLGIDLWRDTMQPNITHLCFWTVTTRVVESLL